MKRLVAPTVLLGAFFLPTAFADATFRQVMEMKTGIALPAGAAAMANPFAKPIEIVCKVKGPHIYSSFGPTVSIMDSAKGEMIILDTAGKRYAVTTLSDYLDKISQSATGGMTQIPEAARQILENMQFKVESHDTGKSERIQGIDTNVSETTLSITIPLPIPIPGGKGNGLEITGSFQLWKPKPGELERLPALREINSYYEGSAKMGGDFTSMLKQLLSAFPGLADKMNDFTAAMHKGTAMTVRMRGSISMPGLAAMLQQAKANGDSAVDIPDGPLFEINSDMKEFSTDPIPDSSFEIPEGYQKAPLEDIVKTMMPTAK